MLKISGESLAGSNEQGFDFNILNDFDNNSQIRKNILSIFGKLYIDCEF